MQTLKFRVDGLLTFLSQTLRKYANIVTWNMQTLKLKGPATTLFFVATSNTCADWFERLGSK
jgi:hypothetical protein